MAGQLMGGPSEVNALMAHRDLDDMIAEQAQAFLEFRDEWRRFGSDVEWLDRPAWFWRDLEVGRTPPYFGSTEEEQVGRRAMSEDGRELTDAEMRAHVRRKRAEFDDLVSKCRRALEEASK